MKHPLTGIFVGTILSLSQFAVATAGQLEDGEAASRQGDYATAWRLLRPLAEQGDSMAQVDLGFFYAMGHGVPEDRTQAVVWYRKAADQGNDKAQEMLGLAYETGQGVPKDPKESVAWYLKAANQGNTDAQDILIISYVYGEAVPQDYTRVLQWVRRSADEGQGTSQIMLGMMYAEGHGVLQDYAQAHMWFNLAAAHAEDPDMRTTATEYRDRLAAKMTPEQIAEAQRMAREWIASHPPK